MFLLGLAILNIQLPYHFMLVTQSRGDIKLIVKMANDPDAAFSAFLISSSAIMRASKYWKRMLASPFSSSQPDHCESDTA